MIRNYYISIIIAAALAIAAFLVPNDIVALGKSVKTGAESVAVILLLVSIPLALKLFQNKTENLDPSLSKEERSGVELYWANIRIWMVAIPLYLNEILFMMTKNTSSMYCCIISAVVLIFFCKLKK